MRRIKLKLIIVLSLGLGITSLQAQETIPAAGDNISGSGGSVSYSLGQIATQTNIGTNGSVVEGIQQPFEIFVITAIDKTDDIQLTVSAYPSPTKDKLTLEVNNYNLSNVNLQLYDLQGKILQTTKISDIQTVIDMKNFVPSTYFVKLTDGNKEIKTFKIIKN